MILLFGADGEGNSLVSLDDPVLSTDRGADFSAVLAPQPWMLNPGGETGHLRRFTQNVRAAGSAVGTITPETDGVPGVTQTFTEAPGGEWSADLDEAGDEATVIITIDSHVGIVELGDSVSISVPKRSTVS